MRRNLLTATSFMCFFAVNAQVGINTQAPKATLDITAKNTNGSSPEGVIAPRLTGTQIANADSQYTSAQAGIIVYATSVPASPTTKTAKITAAGYYYFDGTAWSGMGAQNTTTTLSVSSIIDPNILGYVPSTTATATNNAPANITVNGISCTRTGTATYNGHSYAAYSAGAAGITWYNAYDAAKSMGGYLVTFTADAEWEYIETNLLANSSFNNQYAWIGFAKFSWFAGPALTPDPEEKWITGEQPLHDYSAGGTSAVRKSNWFSDNQPSGGGEGFVQTSKKSDNLTKVYNSYTSTHPWNDFVANPGNLAGFIVEFQQ